MATIPCICPPKATGEPRHETDEITFRERLDFRSAMACRQSIVVLRAEDPGTATGEYLAALTEGYMLYGIEAWTLVDAKGKPVEVTKAAIRELLLTQDVAMSLADEADERYGPQVLLPLLQAAARSSQPTPTDDSTSPPTDSSSKSPKRSSRSSITSIPTGATATTTKPPAGGSSTSPSEASAA